MSGDLFGSDALEVLNNLPPVTAKPCVECPWRRDSKPGHLGPVAPEQWLRMVHGETPIACHMTIEYDGQPWPELRQCAGSAIYRANVHKQPHHPDVAVADEQDKVTVFGWDNEFLDHHGRKG